MKSKKKKSEGVRESVADRRARRTEDQRRWLAEEAAEMKARRERRLRRVELDGSFTLRVGEMPVGGANVEVFFYAPRPEALRAAAPALIEVLKYALEGRQVVFADIPPGASPAEVASAVAGAKPASKSPPVPPLPRFIPGDRVSIPFLGLAGRVDDVRPTAEKEGWWCYVVRVDGPEPAQLLHAFNRELVAEVPAPPAPKSKS